MSSGADSRDIPGARRRNVELAMLIFAAVVVTAAAAIVDENSVGHITTTVGYAGAGFAAIWIVAHLFVRWLAPYADPIFLPSVALLGGLGLVLIHRLDLAYAQHARQLHETVPRADTPLQIMWMCAGLVFFVFVLGVIRNHRTLDRYGYLFGLAALVLLIIPGVLPAGMSEVNGARIWIRLGPFSIQPGEFAKLALMIFFASYLVAKRDLLSHAGRRILGVTLPRARDLGPVVIAWLASLAILARESDLGTSLLFFGIFVAMLYVVTQRVSWVLIGLVLFAGGATFIYSVVPHVRERVTVWLHPFRYASGHGYQIVQALFGLGTGGLFGTGLGNGQPQMVPYANTDFISATVGEELGMFGLVAILVLYAVVVVRGFGVGLRARDPFGALLAAGLAFAMGFQVFIIVGGVTRLIPLTGLTTPFLSYGGSSLVANFALIALLLRISDAARRPPPVPVTGIAAAQTEVISR